MALYSEFRQRMRARARDGRIIGDDVAETLGAHEIRHHEIVVRLGFQRSRVKRGEIQVGHELSGCCGRPSNPREKALIR